MKLDWSYGRERLSPVVPVRWPRPYVARGPRQLALHFWTPRYGYFLGVEW